MTNRGDVKLLSQIIHANHEVNGETGALTGTHGAAQHALTLLMASFWVVSEFKTVPISCQYSYLLIGICILPERYTLPSQVDSNGRIQDGYFLATGQEISTVPFHATDACLPTHSGKPLQGHRLSNQRNPLRHTRSAVPLRSGHSGPPQAF